MTISSRIQQELCELDELDASRRNRTANGCSSVSSDSEEEAGTSNAPISSKRRDNIWAPNEHERFLEALERYPAGPWRMIAEFVGNKTPRQAMTHAQKYRQKMERRKKRRDRLRIQQEALRCAITQINRPTQPMECVTPCHDTSSVMANIHGYNPQQLGHLRHLSPCQRSHDTGGSSSRFAVKRELELEDHKEELDLDKDCIEEILTDVAVAHAAGQLLEEQKNVVNPASSRSVACSALDSLSFQECDMVMECLALLTDAGTAASSTDHMH